MRDAVSSKGNEGHFFITGVMRDRSPMEQGTHLFITRVMRDRSLMEQGTHLFITRAIKDRSPIERDTISPSRGDEGIGFS